MRMVSSPGKSIRRRREICPGLHALAHRRCCRRPCRRPFQATAGPTTAAPPGVATAPDRRSCTYVRRAAVVASLALFGRRAARSACHCAVLARYASPPLRVAALRRNSREIVDAARPSRRAISRMPWPCARHSAISSRSANTRYRPESGFVDGASDLGDIPPASRHQRGPTAGDTPASIAAASLDRPAAIAAQNRRRFSRCATPGRPGDRGNTARSARSERRLPALIATPSVKVLRRQLEPAFPRWIEIPEITPDVTRVTLHGGTCPCCRARFKAAAPRAYPPGSPFGPNLRAFVLYLRFAQAIPFERLARLLSALFGLAISEGALANMLKDSAPAFEIQASAIRRRLLASTVLQSDETSMRVGNRTFWTWVFHHGDSACFAIRPSRGKAVVAAFLGDVRPAFWVSDRLAAQMGWATRGHQGCLAHLLRDVRYALEAGADPLAPRLTAPLKRAVRIGRRRPELADATLAAYHARLQVEIDALLGIVPATEAGRKLRRIVKRFRQNLFVFVTNR